uniref:Capsid protein n=1 Tax=Porcine associated porprismacovirus TaxID=2496634 RepID=A0A515J4L4_9VIRU|nr:capsid protein [Porcine associated porprismacovirus]
MVKASVMEIYDLQTKVGQGTVLKIHTPTGTNVKRHLFGHFLQYKQFKYLGAKLSLIPASTLPVDPTGLSYEAGDATVDPRDMVNPILWKHYHGETMLTDTLPGSEAEIYGNNPDGPSNSNSYIGTSIDKFGYAQYSNQSQFDYVYPNALMDTSFRKSGIQSGFSTFVKPFVYNVVNTKQMLPYASGSSNAGLFSGVSSNGDGQVNPVRAGTSGELEGDFESQYIEPKPSGTGVNVVKYNSQFIPEMFTNRLTPLGWMDTLQRMHENINGGTAVGILPEGLSSSMAISGTPNIGPYLPKIPMLYVLMPPAYKTEFYFRLIVKHYFAFKGFRSCFSIQAPPSAGIAQYGIPAPPSYGTASTASAISAIALDLEESRTDTIDIENGELRIMADGTEGE